jgi:hypothetical protein
VAIQDAKGRRAYGYVEQDVTTAPKPEEVERAIGRGELDVSRLWKRSKRTVFREHVPQRKHPSVQDGEMIAALQESLVEAKAKRDAA